MNTLEFKKYNRKYIIVQSFDDTKLPADDEVLGEGVVIVYTPTGNLEDAERIKIGDGATTFADLSWLYDLDQIKVNLINPTIRINNQSGLITAQAQQPAGYTTGGTSKTTYQLSTQAAKTVTPSKSTQTAVSANRYTTGAVTVAAIPDTYVDTTSGDAKASDIRSGKKAWVDGIEVTGNLGSAIFMNNQPTISLLQAGVPMINIPVKVLQPGIVDADIPHTASWILTSLEPNLKAENIPEGLSLFQIAGSLGWGDTEAY